MTPQELLKILVANYAAGDSVPVYQMFYQSDKEMCEQLAESNLSFNNLSLRYREVSHTYYMEYNSGRHVLTELSNPELIF